MQLQILANAKINLTLYITGKLNNGYHTLDTIMQSIELQDKLTVDLNDSKEISVTCSDCSLCGEKNLAYSAATTFLDAVHRCGQGVSIHIEKNIPLAGGLGGGSADAAAVLIALNRLMNEPLTLEQLKELALPLGADVPFCLVGGTCRATGIGECLTPLQVQPQGWVVLAKPCEKESTADMYRKYDEIKGLHRENSCVIIDKMGSEQWVTLKNQLHNDFLPLYDQKEIFLAIETMKQCGAETAMLSGSGPTVFGVFSDEAVANSCVAKMETRFGWSCAVPFASCGWQIL